MNNKLLKGLIIIVFFIFTCSYIVCENGYYEYTLAKKTSITNDKIKEFELLIKDNQDISDWEYFYEEDVDYTNRFSDMIYEISDNSNRIFRKYLKKIFKKIGEAVSEED